MPIQLSDDLFEHLAPPETVDWTLVGVHYPRTNPEPIILELKWAGAGSDYAKEQKKLALKPLDDEADDLERDLRSFAKHAIGGWRNVIDGDAPAKFDAKIAGELLVRTMRARKKQGLVEARIMLQYAMSPSAFRRPDPVDAADLGKE
jgi:hypothetical protein